jgi:hypothetical protein
LAAGFFSAVFFAVAFAIIVIPFVLYIMKVFVSR